MKTLQEVKDEVCNKVYRTKFYDLVWTTPDLELIDGIAELYVEPFRDEIKRLKEYNERARKFISGVQCHLASDAKEKEFLTSPQ